MRLRVYLTRILLFLAILISGFVLYCAVWAYCGSKTIDVVVLFPNEAIRLDTVATDAFRINGLNMPVIGIEEWTDLHLVIAEKKKNLKRRANYRFAFMLEPYYGPMARQMSVFTDNLATHDCLYYPKLIRLYDGCIPILYPTFIWKNAACFHKVQIWLISFFQGLFCSAKSTDVEFVEHGKKDVSYDAVYRLSELECLYAFSEINNAERTWGLFYYPTILIDADVETEGQGLVLLASTNKQRLFEYYALLSDGFYVRIWCPHKLNKQDVTQYLERYETITLEANTLIQNHFTMLGQ